MNFKALTEEENFTRELYTEILDGTLEFVVISEAYELGYFDNIIPGSFNPFHEGHKNLFEEVEARYGETYLEISLSNRFKPPISYSDLMKRLENIDVPILISNAPYFRDKAKIFPGAIFHVGTDVSERVLKDHTREELENDKVIIVNWPREKSLETIFPSESWPKDWREEQDYYGKSLSSTLIRKYNGPRVSPTVDIGIFFVKTKRVLLGRKSSDPPNRYRFVGGFVDPRDSNYQRAALRELFEETLIDIKNFQDPKRILSFDHLGSFNIKDPRLEDQDGIMSTLFGAYFLGTEDFRASDDIEELREFEVYDFVSHLVDHHKEMGIHFFKTLLKHLEQ